jgi:histidine triad (HIT) family protein
MATIFSKIVAGEIPGYKVAETDDFLAFLDIFPLKKGHVLVIPKKEVDYLFDLDEETYQGLWQFAHKVAVAIERAMPCKRIGVAVLGMEVPHAHIHLVPLHHEGDLSFSNPKLKFTPREFEEIAASIAANI